MKDYKRLLITAALPYANGPLHIGHLAGVYLPADIYCRYQRARKRDIKLVGGSDEHGVPITIRAMTLVVHEDHFINYIKRNLGIGLCNCFCGIVSGQNDNYFSSFYHPVLVC